VPPAQPHRLLRPQAGVGEQRHQHAVARLEQSPDCLDGLRGERPALGLLVARRFADEPGGVCGGRPGLARPLKDVAEQPKRPSGLVGGAAIAQQRRSRCPAHGSARLPGAADYSMVLEEDDAEFVGKIELTAVRLTTGIRDALLYPSRVSVTHSGRTGRSHCPLIV
jgi:hypothetical protein